MSSYFKLLFHDSCNRVGAVHIAMGWAARGSNPVVREIFLTR